MKKTTIDFTSQDYINDTSFFLGREATVHLSVDDPTFLQLAKGIAPSLPIKVSYILDGELDSGDSTTPRITDVGVESIDTIDDWAYANGLSEGEQERRMDIRDAIYATVETRLRNHYGLDAKTTEATV